MGRAGESLFQGKEAELCRTTQIRGGRRPAARVLGTRVRTPNLRAWGYAQVLCWTLLSITYSLGLWLREKNWGHCTPPPPPIMEMLELSPLYIGFPSDSSLTENLCRVGPQGSLRWEWRIWLVWAQISFFFFNRLYKKCGTKVSKKDLINLASTFHYTSR